MRITQQGPRLAGGLVAFVTVVRGDAKVVRTDAARRGPLDGEACAAALQGTIGIGTTAGRRHGVSRT